MTNGTRILFMLFTACLVCRGDGRTFATNTKNWNSSSSGDRMLKVVKHSPDICYLNIRFVPNNGVIYLDCKREHFTVGLTKICGQVDESYMFPFEGTDLNIIYSGESPLYLAIEETLCGGAEMQSCSLTTRELITEIKSPNYPDRYPPLSSCTYTIIPANDGICGISIRFYDLEVEDSPNCHKDQIALEDEIICGNKTDYSVSKNINGRFTIRFESDYFNSGRGFRAKIEQVHCGNTLLRYSRLSECCGRVYTQPYLILSSPGLLRHLPSTVNCRFLIHRSHPNICRLRFHFRYFRVGQEDAFYGCVNGYLEIDGRRFCGCLDGIEYLSLFDNVEKEIRYSGGTEQGFVIEVNQETCQDFDEYPFSNSSEIDPNTEVEVFKTNVTGEKSVSRFLIPTQDSGCWKNSLWQDQVLSFLANSPVPAYCEAQENGLAFSSRPQLYPFNGLHPPAFEPPVPRPPAWPPTPSEKCLILDKYFGIVQSPFYPRGYLPNIRNCYMFKRLPNACALKIYFLDFDIENSYQCWKDNLVIEKIDQHCGRSLKGRSVLLNFPYRGLSYLHLFTDSTGSGRGFYAKYQQLPCVFGNLK